MQLYTISRNGRLNVWDCNTKLDGLVKRNKGEDDDLVKTGNLDEDEIEDAEDKNEEKDLDAEDENEEAKKKNKVAYRKVAK